MSLRPLQPAHRAPDQRIPNALLLAILVVVLASLVAVTAARLSGMQPMASPDDSVGIVKQRMIRIDGTLGGSARIFAPDGTLIADLGPKEAGFITGVQSALDRERMLYKIDGNPPIRIVRFADGRLGLRDPATGWRVELIGFGDTNRDAFAALLE